MNEYLNFEILKVGNKIPQLSHTPANTIVEWNGDELRIIHVTDPIIRQQIPVDPSTRSMEIGLYTHGNVMTLAVKMGGLEWVDGCYHPNYCGCVDNVPLDYAKGIGLPAVNLFVDGLDGTIYHLHAFVLSTKFTNCFLADCRQLKDRNATYSTFLKEVRNLQANHTSREIGSKRKQISFKLRLK